MPQVGFKPGSECLLEFDACSNPERLFLGFLKEDLFYFFLENKFPEILLSLCSYYVHYSTGSGTLGLSLYMIFRERTPFAVMLNYLEKGIYCWLDCTLWFHPGVSTEYYRIYFLAIQLNLPLPSQPI